MLDLRNRVLLTNDDECCLCKQRLAINTEAYKGFIPESAEEKTLCERCAVIDENYADLDLSIDMDLISVLCDAGYIACPCGSDNLNIAFADDEPDTVIVKCLDCDQTSRIKVDEESLVDYFLEQSVDSEYAEYDEDDEDEDEMGYTEEEKALYTDDYVPDTDYMQDIINSADSPFKAVKRN